MDRNQTYDISTSVRLDTLRLRVSESELLDEIGVKLADVYNKRKRKGYFRVGESVAVANLGRSKAGGTAIEWSGKSLRILSPIQQITLLGSVLYRLGGRVTVPRADWAVQIPSERSSLEEIIAVAVLAGFRAAKTAKELSVVVGGQGTTTYMYSTVYRRAGSSVRTNRFLLRIYQAMTLAGLSVWRIEVQEQLVARLLSLATPLIPAAITARMLAPFGELSFRADEAVQVPPRVVPCWRVDALRSLSYLERVFRASERPPDLDHVRYLAAELADALGLHDCMAERWPLLVTPDQYPDGPTAIGSDQK